MERAGVRSAGNPHAAYDVAEAGNGVKGRIEAPENGENLRPTATPRPCGYRASFRPYRRAATGNGAMAGSEAPALRKLPGTATPIRLPLPRQLPTLQHLEHFQESSLTHLRQRGVVSLDLPFIPFTRISTPQSSGKPHVMPWESQVITGLSLCGTKPGPLI